MNTLIWSLGFKRSFKRSIRRRPDLQDKIEHAMKLLANDALHPSLHTHKLKGDLAGSWACTVDFEYRIVFEFVRDSETQEEIILLEAVGTHDEVY
ncbi:MAG: type II toxin-antitoxin system RelE/ParE family toxin [Methanothrix sp.]